MSTRFPVTEVSVSGVTWTVAVADNPGDRSRGLRGVTDLGDLDGMLFAYEEDSTTTFGMRNVPISLDIAWFSADGVLLDRASMTPCPSTPCTSYAASTAYRYALETVPGGFDGLEPLTLSLTP